MATCVSFCMLVASLGDRSCVSDCVSGRLSQCVTAYVCVVYPQVCFGMCVFVCVTVLFSVCLMVYA